MAVYRERASRAGVPPAHNLAKAPSGIRGPSARRILVIEDHRNLGELIKLHLEAVACDVKVDHDGRTGMADAESGRYDLIVLDLMLPGLDGLEICRRLRHRGSYLPILMLTAKTAESDRVAGLEIGADDYLAKPFSVVELVARVKALLRRRDVFDVDRTRPKSATYAHGPLSIDESKREVTLRGDRLDLTAKEFELLVLLAGSPGKTFTRAQLLDHVWGYNFTGCENTLKTHVNRLRCRIEDEPDNPRYILTVWGVGYRFADAETLGK
jgi:DNA-binding response OmpR family regulator